MISIILGLGHLCFVIFFVCVILASKDPSIINAWFLFLALDFPASLGFISLSYYLDGTLFLNEKDASGTYQLVRDINNFWLPALYFGTVGSYWWYLLPKLLSRLKTRFFKALS